MRLLGCALLVLLTSTGSANATSPCVQLDTLKAASLSDVVVVGEVLDAVPSDGIGRPAAASQAVRALYRVRVVEEFKGRGNSQYRILGDPPRVADQAALDPGYPLQTGKKYLLLASGEPLRLQPCPPTGPIDQAEEAVRLLRQQRHDSRPSSGRARNKGAVQQ